MALNFEDRFARQLAEISSAKSNDVRSPIATPPDRQLLLYGQLTHPV